MYNICISIERERNPHAACWRVYVSRGLWLAFPTTMQLTLGNDLCDRISTRNRWYSVSVSACNYHQINIFNSYRKEFRVSTGEKINTEQETSRKRRWKSQRERFAVERVIIGKVIRFNIWQRCQRCIIHTLSFVFNLYKGILINHHLS